MNKYKNYILTKKEKIIYDNLKNRKKELEKELSYIKNKIFDFESNILTKFFPGEDIYDGEYWDCKNSPFNRCIYKYNQGDYICIFCGEPEERK